RLALWDAIQLFNGIATGRVIRAAGTELEASAKITNAPPTPRPDVNLSNAIWRAYLGRWSLPIKSVGEYGQEEAQRFYDLVEKDFRQKAFDGELPIWGKRQGSSLVEQ